MATNPHRAGDSEQNPSSRTDEEAIERLSRLQDQVEELTRKVKGLEEGFESYRTRAAELQDYADELYYSRTWQLMLAGRLALASWRGLWEFPLRVWRILSRPPVPPDRGELGPNLLPEYRPHRRSEITGWPADRPLLTVAVLGGNRTAQLRQTVESIADSTLRNFEILLVVPERVNLGADTPWLRESNLRIVRQSIESLPAARNKAAAEARGKYLLLLGEGDRIDPAYLEKAVFLLERSPECAFCYPYLRGAANRTRRTARFDLGKALEANPVPSGTVFRLEAWAEAGGFREVEFDVWNFWITLGAKGWDGCLIPEPLLLEHGDGESLSEADARRGSELLRESHGYLYAPDTPGAIEDPAERDRVREKTEILGIDPDPAVRKALSQPPQPSSAEQDNEPFEHRRFQDFSERRPAVLFVVHWADTGGAEKLVLQIMQGVADEFSPVLATTLPSQNRWHSKYADVCSAIYHLPNLRVTDPANYLRHLVEAHDIKHVVVSLSRGGYEALPELRRLPGLWAADIVHNTTEEGYIRYAIEADRFLDVHFAVGVEQAQALWSKGKIARQKIHVAVNGVDTQGEFNPARYHERLAEIRSSVDLRGDETVLTFAGRLSVEKDVPLFLNVVAELQRRHPERQIRTLIAGDGPERLRVEGLIDKLDLRRTTKVLGFCENLPEILAASDFVLVTSRYEGTSLTLLEAMSMECVVISADVGNVRQFVEDGVNGLVVPGRDAADFARQFERVFQNPSGPTRIGRAARNTVVQRFDLSDMQARYLEAFRAALGQRAVRAGAD